MDGSKSPRYESLKDLIPSTPRPRTPTPAYPGYLKTRYAKRKEPLCRNGVAIYWEEVPLIREEGAEYHGFCDLFDGHVAETMKPGFDKGLEPLRSLLKFVSEPGKQKLDF